MSAHVHDLVAEAVRYVAETRRLRENSIRPFV